MQELRSEIWWLRGGERPASQLLGPTSCPGSPRLDCLTPAISNWWSFDAPGSAELFTVSHRRPECSLALMHLNYSILSNCRLTARMRSHETPTTTVCHLGDQREASEGLLSPTVCSECEHRMDFSVCVFLVSLRCSV